MTPISRVWLYFLATAFLTSEVAALKTYITLDKDVKVWIYRSSSTYFVIEATLPRHWWLALSYGGSHVNSDIVVLKANGYDRVGDSIAPEVYDCKSLSYTDITCVDAGSAGTYGLTNKHTLEDYVEFYASRRWDPSGTEDYVVEEDTPIVMGYAIRRHDEDIELDNDGLVVDFLNHQRHGYFEIVIPSSLASSRGYVDGTENTRYRAITVQSAQTIGAIGASMALLLTTNMF